MREKRFQSPARYIQGKGVLGRLSEFSDALGSHCLLILSKGGMKRLSSVLEETEKNAKTARFTRVAFEGECCMEEINRISEIARQEKCDVIVGIGGGKVLDTAKAVAHYTNHPIIVAPTTASSDAPCSALSVVYKKDGSLDRLLQLHRNPDTVLVDSAIIAKASPRLFAAGIGDALATYYEMKACWDTDSDNFIHGRICLAAKAIAQQCRDTLMEDGLKAYSAVKQGLCTTAVENVIEANILLSGLGFESGGTSGAHTINNGIAELPATRTYYHGEKVAFSLICQFVLTNESMELIRSVQTLLHAVGLPITLQELGIQELSRDDLALVATIADGDPAIHALPRKVDAAAIAEAVLAANSLGHEFLSA